MYAKLMQITAALLLTSTTANAIVVINPGDWCHPDVQIDAAAEVVFKNELQVITAATPGVAAVTSFDNYKLDKKASNIIGAGGQVIGSCLIAIDQVATPKVQLQKEEQNCEAVLNVKSTYNASTKVITKEVAGLSQCFASVQDLSDEEVIQYFEKVAVYDASPGTLQTAQVSLQGKIVEPNGNIVHKAAVRVTTTEPGGKSCAGSYFHSATFSQDKLVVTTATDKADPLICR